MDSHQAGSRFRTSPQIGNASVTDKTDSGFLNPYSSHPFSGKRSLYDLVFITHFY